MPNLVNQLQALDVRLVTPWTGVWFADVDVQLDETGIAPSGKVALTLGTASVYLGTVDPRASGTFGGKAKLRILGGGAGWDQPVRALQLHNDAGVLSTAIYSATAAEAGEVVIDPIPQRLGIDFMRPAGPASRVFASREDWYVTPQGITTVGPRLPIPFNPTSTEILSWDPLTRTAELASNEPIAPGTILIDPVRIGKPVTIRDLEQRWSDGGVRATAWCGENSGSRLSNALGALVDQKSGIVYLRTYKYRVVAQAPDERLILQAVSKEAGMPDALPLSTWFGIPGLSGKLLPGTIVLVEFIGKDGTEPVVRAFEGGAVPISLQLNVGVAFSINGGVRPVAALGDFAGPFPIAATGLNMMVP